MRGGAELGARQLQEAVPTQEVDGGHLLALAAVEARQAAADGLAGLHQALGAVLAVPLVTGAGLQQDHGWRVLAEQPAGRASGETKLLLALWKKGGLKKNKTKPKLGQKPHRPGS